MRALIAGFSDLFLPNCCLLCHIGLRETETYVCPACWASLTVFPDRSGRPFRSLRGVLDRLWIGWDYESKIRSIIHLFKYESRPELAANLVQEWRQTLPLLHELQTLEVIIPVPIHAARRRWRGYNQSELLAVQIARDLDIPVLNQEALRLINTPSQTLLDREARWRSVSAAFSLVNASAILGKRVLIVDDLVTSGATLYALAALLLCRGAATVSGAVLTSPEIGES